MLLRNARRLVVLIMGITVILVGIAGLVLPVIPGVVCIIMGVAILATEFLWARRLMDRIKQGGTSIADKFKGRPKAPDSNK